MDKKIVQIKNAKRDLSYKSSLLSVKEDPREDNYSKMDIENSESELSEVEFSYLETRKRAITISTMNMQSPLRKKKRRRKLSAKFTKCSPFLSGKKKKDGKKKESEIYFNNTFQKLKNFKITNLKKSEITPKLRSKIMDWMVEVLKLYNQREETIYRSFYILDLYLQKKKININYLHLIGTACIFIASKNEEVNFLPTQIILDKICYNKFTKKDLLAAELDILNTINFRVNFPSIYDILTCTFNLLDISDNKIKGFLKNSCLLITKMCLFSDVMCKRFTLNYIAGLSVILVLKLIENLHPGRNFDKFIKNIVCKFEMDKRKVIENLSFIKNFVFNFDETFPFIRNLKRFYTFSF